MNVPEELRTPAILKRDAPHDFGPSVEAEPLAKLLARIRKTRGVLKRVMDKEGKGPLVDFFNALDATLELELRCAQSLLAAVETGDLPAAERHSQALKEASALALPLNYADFTLKGVLKGRRARA